MVLVACGDLVMPAQDDAGEDQGDSDDAGDQDVADVRVDAPPAVHEDADTLHLVTFTANPSTVVSGQSLHFHVVVSDDMGMGDLAGGEITDDGGATYAHLLPSGSFSNDVTLSWTDIQRIHPLQFTGPVVTRTFTVTYRSRGGRSASAQTVVNFQCAPSDGGACK